MNIYTFLGFISVLKLVSCQVVSIEPVYNPPESQAVIFKNKDDLKLQCKLIANGYAPGAITVIWKKEGTQVSEIKSLENRFKIDNIGNSYYFNLTKAEYGDAGNYTCTALVNNQETAEGLIRTATLIHVKIKSDNINVVENDKLRIECSILGNPQPVINWRIESENFNGSDFDSRVKIQDYRDESNQNVVNGALIIDPVNKTDRGHYFCIGTNVYLDTQRDETESIIRVKDQYAALWPFIGICIEVIVLCAIIIIYEKKRNKSELEESDTDQSPDQKNTPDHGKEANLRHRQ
ncbi:neuroplastin isoform X2 [Anthonomus grandis grandis]|uniref:neuroplastin isoform X2 n=1 Tax=Anthonomus grandis grandis TaxID=2921223 RepID=UPI002165D48E|nr:neuroplastin isoform X2 [Anthonomus grandis grandis]